MHKGEGVTERQAVGQEFVALFEQFLQLKTAVCAFQWDTFLLVTLCQKIAHVILILEEHFSIFHDIK